ncbi:hypothetical protein HID58_005787 [Brassica napus]|uniref:Plasma membrane ATPase n=2 Tax=Brassica TaxID=3705 RepID=A0ABQ8E9J1_BRANA|nr:hypothetical protein HID58_005787 [Brassica napus]
MLISHGFLDFNGRCRLACVLTNVAGEAIHGWFHLSTIGEAHALAWQVATPPVAVMVHAWFAFMLIALIWEFDFSAFMVLIIAILNDGTIMTISKDRVKPSPTPDSWKLKEIFATGIVLGGYQAVMSVVFFWSIHKTDFFSLQFTVDMQDKFGVRSIMDNNDELMGAVYLQSSAIFVTRSRSWSFVERPGALLMIAFVIAQLVATLIAVYADSGRLLRLRELHTLKGHVESVAKLKGLDIDTAGHRYMCSCSCTYTFYQNQPIMTLVEFLCLYIQMLLVRFFFNSEERFDMFFFLRILQIRQGMYTSVFGAREPETGRILAFKKARFDNFEADSVRSITRQIVVLRKLNQRFMQDVDACVRKLKVEALARARKEFVHTSNGFVLCRKSNKVEKDHEKSYIWWLVVKRACNKYSFYGFTLLFVTYHFMYFSFISNSYISIFFFLHDNNRENINHTIRLKYHYILGQEFLIESSISYLFPSRKGFYKQTTKKGISRSKPSSRKAPPKHAAIQVSDATQQEMLISHGFLDFNGRCRLACVLTNVAGEAIHGWFHLSTIGEAHALAWQVATPPVAVMVHAWFAFMLIALIWEFDFSAFMVLIIAILNDGTIMTISKDRVKPSPTPDSWKLKEIFATGIVLGGYQAVMSVVFFWSIHKTDFFSLQFTVDMQDKFGVRSIMDNNDELMGAVYLQSSAIFVTRSRSWSFVERPGALLMIAFVIAQLVATLIAVYADSGRLLRLRELHTLKGHVESVAKLKGLDIDTAGHRYMCSCSCTYTFYQNQPIMTLIRQGMYTSVFGAREPETGRILAFKKARFDNFEADSVRSITRQIVRFMQDVDACVRKLKVEALARARKEFVHTSNGFVLCRKSNKVEKDHEKSYIWWLVVKRVL